MHFIHFYCFCFFCFQLQHFLLKPERAYPFINRCMTHVQEPSDRAEAQAFQIEMKSLFLH
ncbi:hypothetical protein Barb4_05424 [Bacteroidales bacterium Barb4]|nr:hypothetical protein Barb4_05424 [Bacteroidales bacterium Barb4]